jgi:formamidase
MPVRYSNDAIHNRWHSDIPMVATVQPGDDFIIPEVLRLDRHSSIDDASDVARHRPQHRALPERPGRRRRRQAPGDLLVVDFLDIGAFQTNQWGFNGFFSSKWRGTLTEHFHQAQKSILGPGGISPLRHVPALRFPTPPGLIGCLPSRSLLDKWNADAMVPASRLCRRRTPIRKVSVV